MHATKLFFMVMIGLAMIEFSIGQPLHAATAPKAVASKTSPASSKHAGQSKPMASSAQLAKSSSKIKSAKIAKTTSATKGKKTTPSMKGLAAVYSNKLIGRKTSSGQKFCQTQMTAAHRSLPLGAKVLVTNVRNQKSVEVRITDRGPHHGGRVIDLTTAAAAKIGMTKTGSAYVTLEIITDDSINKS